MTKNNDSHGLTVSTKYDSREIKLRGRRWRRSVRWREFAEVADWFGSSMVYQLEILKLFWKLWIAASLRILPLWESNWRPWRSWLESRVACGLVNKDKHTVWVTGLLKEYCIRAFHGGSTMAAAIIRRATARRRPWSTIATSDLKKSQNSVGLYPTLKWYHYVFDNGLGGLSRRRVTTNKQQELWRSSLRALKFVRALTNL